MWQVTIILLFFINVTLNCVIDHRSKEAAVEQKLHRYLLKDYLAYQPPCTNTTVKLRFILKYFYFGDNEEDFHVYTWTLFTWDDPRLAWKPEDYDSLHVTLMEAIFLWRPHASFKNVNDLNDESDESIQSSTLCQVLSDGIVNCMLQQYHVTSCKTNLTNWPYDSQFCSFNLIAERSEQIKYRHHTVTYSLTSEQGLLRSGALSYGPGWDIVDTNSSIIEVNGTSIKLDFLVQRQALGFATIVIIPSIVITIFTLSSMFLDARCYVRIVILSLSLVNHLILLEIISVFIPRHNIDTPLILRFICASIFITTCAIVLTVTLHLLMKKKTSTVMKVLFSFNKSVLETRLKYFVFPKRNVISNEQSEDLNGAEIWTNFASIVNSLFLHTFLAVYLVLYCVLMPKPS